MITSKYTIREHNEALILNEIINHKNVSRANLAARTQLNKASVSSIIKTLISEQLVLETGVGDASFAGGRRPILLQFNGKAALSISLDIGYNYIKAMLAYIDGIEIAHLFQADLQVSSSNIIQLIEQIVQQMELQQPPTVHGIIGLSLAIHGIVQNNNITFTPYYDLDTIQIHQILTSKFEYPVHLENEANLAALGEYTFSSNFENLVSVNIHSGIGAGIVQHGKLQVGNNGKAGEIGHSIIKPNGKKCPCGNNGCLEQYASTKILFEELERHTNLSTTNSSSVARLYNNRDKKTLDLLRENASFLSIGINNIAAFYDPEVIIINSSIYSTIPDLINDIHESLNNSFSKNIHLRISQLGEKATLFGGLAKNIQVFLNIQTLKLVKKI